MRLILAALLIIAAQSSSTLAQSKTASVDRETQAVRKAAESFIEALNNLEWERFRKSFVDEATVFFPAEVPGRANGRGEVEAGFKTMFDEGRKQGGGPPYLHVEPKDLMIQMAGSAAVMTFHLERPGGLARRTIVWQKRGGKWLILHLHASGVMF